MNPINFSRWLTVVCGVLLMGLLLSFGVTQEVPLGKVSGRILMQENKNPLPGASVTFTPMSDIDKEVIRVRYVDSGDNGGFVMSNLPAGAYEMEVSAQNHRADKRYVWIEEGKTQELGDIDLKPDEPYLQLYASQRVFEPNEKPRIEMHGFTPAKNVEFRIYRLSLEHLTEAGGLDQALYPLSQNPQMARSAGKLTLENKQTVLKRDVEGAFIQQLPIPTLDPGFYFAQVTAGDKLRASAYLNITSIAMISKTTKAKTLAFVTDLKSGKPIAGATVLVKRGGGMQKAGLTGPNGTLEVDSAEVDHPALVAQLGSSTAVVGFGNYQNSNSAIHIVSYTERPVYRPGDQIFFKSVIRRWSGDSYVLPGSGTAKVELRDPSNNVVQSTDLPISSHGSINGTFTTTSEAEPGYWTLRVATLGGVNLQNVPILAYRKPDYTVTVKSTKDYFILGETASAKVHAEYYFGGPVIGAKVQANIYRSPDYDSIDSDDQESFDSHFQGGEFSQQVEATTDANGDAIINFPTRAENDPDVYPSDFIYSVSASVADEGDKYFDGDGQVPVARGDFDVSVQPSRYVVDPGQKIELTLSTKDHDHKKPVPNRKVTVVVGQERWTERTSYFVPLSNYEATTDANGDAVISVDAGKTGSIEIKAAAVDDSGRRIEAENYVWAAGPDETWNPDIGDFKVTLDKKSYSPGEKAKILLQTDKPGGSALVTVEAERIYWQKVVPLDRNSTIVPLDIAENFAPNAFVSASYIRDKKYMSAERSFDTDRPDRSLTVSVTPSKPSYKPGDQAELTVSTTDQDGKPTPANVSVAVVDESIYAVQSDDTDLARDLYPERYDEVVTGYSFPEVYLDGGDKGANQVELRTKFKDTAFWQPSIETNKDGKATLQFQLPDNLTEWRATAIGVTDASVAGQATANFKARKDLMVRILPPMFLTQYDKQQVSVVVTNDTGRDQDVNLQVDATGADLEGTRTQVLHVPSGTPQAVPFVLDAQTPGQATLTARAWVNGGPSDGVRQSLPVNAHARLEVQAKAGDAKPFGTEVVNLDPDASTSVGSLKITLSPSLASGIVKSLPDLVDYPYGCVEQTMSRFLPSVLVSNAFQQIGLSIPNQLQKKISAVSRDSFSRLAKMQHSDGGFGWWEYDDSSAFMTALVLDGIDRAKQAGYPPRVVDVKRALNAASKLSKTPPTDHWLRQQWDRDRVYLAYVLARWGRKEDAAAAIKRFDLRQAGPSECALAALAAHELGQTDLQDSALSRLIQIAQYGNLTASWAAQEYSWGVEPTALALVAFMTCRPDDPVVPKIVRYLMLARKGDMWTSTRDTSYTLIGLSSYLARNKGELVASVDAMVSLNGHEIQRIQVPTNSTDPNDGVLTIPIDRLTKGQNQIRIQPEAGQRCFYTVELRQYVVKKDLEPKPANGLTVRRDYYILEPRRTQDGRLRLLPSEKPVTQVHSGDIIRVILTINSDVDRNYVMLEDPLLSNCHVTEQIDPEFASDWSWWWSKTVLRDDRITFFATWMKAGVNQISYTMRAESPGTCGALPPHIENMYDPSQWASAGSQQMEVSK